ncbi:MAG: 30S ribosomal protein S12 methylthiotransferase RimO [Anaerolineae bacterium]|nr:30S ribosomal protein S12 methylthiotransferase RimO [Anaerolineae bacterium]
MRKRFSVIRGARRPFRFYIASLGCPKNTVDSNAMGVLLQRSGYTPTLDAKQADIVIVNTCGFIEAARAESLETLQDLAASLTKQQRLVAAGCWAQRDPDVILEAVPRIDAILGTRSWPQIVPLAERLLAAVGEPTVRLVEERLATMPEEAHAPGYVISGKSAFLKIADGCSRQCAFCAIPAIKGPTVSRDFDAVLEDVRQLRDYGMLEINLIAQDATYYGADRGERDGLAQLFERMVAVAPEVPWIRVLYAFPGYITPRLIDVMRDTPQILPYIDLPLQHAHPDVLRRMRRPADMNQVRRTLDALRSAMPDVALRTTLIVGFPGETDAEFADLVDFVAEVRFDRLGVFTYSNEAGTTAAALGDDVPAEVKEARYDQIMALQQEISYERNQTFVGKRLTVLLEGSGDDLTVGRSYRDAPEIDGLVLVREVVEPHRLVTVEITEALPYDLAGRIV